MTHDSWLIDSFDSLILYTPSEKNVFAEAQLTVRKFVQSREKLKNLLCEADLAIMLSKTEEFGFVAVEALATGLPILVGSKSGMAKT